MRREAGGKDRGNTCGGRRASSNNRPGLGRPSLAAASLSALALAAVALAGCLVSVVGAGPAVAAVSTVGDPCSFHLGPPFETGALGSFGLEVPVYPANPHHTCSVTVAVQASLTQATGGAYTNVAGDPSTQTVTLAFNGGPLPLGLLWTWSPHCADPASQVCSR